MYLCLKNTTQSVCYVTQIKQTHGKHTLAGFCQHTHGGSSVNDLFVHVGTSTFTELCETSLLFFGLCHSCNYILLTFGVHSGIEAKGS